MREPFEIAVRAGELYWRELSWRDARPLRAFFADVRDNKVSQLAIEDGLPGLEDLNLETRLAYEKEAAGIIYTLRGLPLGIDQVLPLVADLALPNILRAGQPAKDLGRGLFGYHFAVLREFEEGRVVGVSTLEKAGDDRAEITAWVDNRTSRGTLLDAWATLMDWTVKNTGYRHFIAHVEKPTTAQRGNQRAINIARRLGFETIRTRAAADPKGNGKDTVVLEARGWHIGKVRFPDANL